MVSLSGWQSSPANILIMRQSVHANALGLAAHPGGAGLRRRRHARFSEAHAPLLRGIVIGSVFAVLASAGWFVGSPEVMSGLQHFSSLDRSGHQRDRATESNGPLRLKGKHSGTVVMELPDNVSCRYLAFNNISGWSGENWTGLCPDVHPPHAVSYDHFHWGHR